MKTELSRKPRLRIVSLALKNLGRHRAKTIITITAISLGILFYLYMDGFLLGANTESKRNLVNYEMGSAKIYSKAYWEKKDEFPLYEGFKNYAHVIERLGEKGYDAAPRAVFAGSLLSENEELPFMFIGGDPIAEKRVFLYRKFIEEGGRFMEDGAFELLLGVRGAHDLGVGAGDAVRLSTVIDKRDEAGRIVHINQAIDLVVCGIINSPDPMINGYTAYIPLDILNDEMGLLLEGSITEIIVRKQGAREDELPGYFESKEAIERALGTSLPETLTVKSWEENAVDYLNASAGDVVSSIVFLAIFFIIVLMVIANTVLMSVLERTKEIGMLRALGMPDGSIIVLFFIEAGFIGFIGAVIGVILSIPLNFYMVNYGVDISSMIQETGITNIGYRVVGVFKSAWNVPVMIASVILATVLSSVTALFPSRRAVRLSITNALRME